MLPSLTPCFVRARPRPQASDLKIAFEENPYTLPNALTLSRMLACPVLAYAIVHDQSFLAGGLLVYAGVTDFVRPPSASPAFGATRALVVEQED